MAGETEFEKIKRIVEEQKTKKVRGETRIAHLKEDIANLYKEMEVETNMKITSIEEGEKIVEELKAGIQKEIREMKKILLNEGIEF